jgi:hypothetical protein
MRWGGGGVKVFQGLLLQTKTTKENQVKNRNVEGKTNVWLMSFCFGCDSATDAGLKSDLATIPFGYIFKSDTLF